MFGLAVLVIVTTARSAWTRAAGARVGWVAGTVGILVALGYALVRGSRLAWDQLALWAVTSDSNGLPRGIWLPDTVKFVLIGDTEISRSDYRTAAWVHAVVLPIVIAISLALVLFWARAARARYVDRRSARSSAPEPVA